DDDSFEDIDYVEASPPDSELVSLEKEKDDILHEKLLNINLLIAFTSSDDESLSDEDVPEDNVKIYSNPLFEFDDEYISSDVNPLFDEVLEASSDVCLAPSDDIELLLHHDPSISVVSILKGFTDEPPLEENDDLFDLESKGNE
ncbi:hypothetical protein Tco_0332638, partial [Tanacetum coccineum]